MNTEARIIDDDTTEMVQRTRGHAKKLVTTLVRKRKQFTVSPVIDEEGRECWLFTISERNDVGGLAGRWGDA